MIGSRIRFNGINFFLIIHPIIISIDQQIGRSLNFLEPRPFSFISIQQNWITNTNWIFS